MYKAGIDLGGTNIKAGIIDEMNRIVAEDSVPTRAERAYQEVIADMAGLVSRLLEQLEISKDALAGIGIGCPGIIDAEKGKVPYSNNISWKNVPLLEEMRRYFDCEMRVSNDANCAALGEVKAGAARGVGNAVLLTLGTGVGGGVVIDGSVFEGAHAGGAELGHTNLIFGGEQCTCGRRGCVEAYVSATALIRDARRAAEQAKESLMNELCEGDISNMNGKIPFDAALRGDAAAKQVVDHYVMYLGEAIADYVNIFRPDIVLLSGGVCNQGENLTKPVEAYIKDKCFGGSDAFIPPVRCAILGNHAGMIGAANLI